jgi:murein DD-endopeptidase MepM/ murein hydrolase activator NlpD
MWRFVALLVCLVWVHPAAQTLAPPLSMSFSLPAIHPGDVVRVDLAGASESGMPTGVAFAKDLSFAFNRESGVWSALIGVDLDIKPGAYKLTAHVTGDPGMTTEATIRIVPKSFRIRRLRVPAGFVDPPPAALEQIARDIKNTSEILAATSPQHWKGAFLLPVDGKPTSNFGTRSYYNGVRRSPHAGVDFLSAPGTPVRASNHGVVVLAEPQYFTGNTVIVDHGAGVFSLFAHLSEFRVEAGDAVGPETIVGLVGATGRVTGPHLHWSVRLRGARVDPLSLIAATR